MTGWKSAARTVRYDAGITSGAMQDRGAPSFKSVELMREVNVVILQS